jgi:hypothetical protein
VGRSCWRWRGTRTWWGAWGGGGGRGEGEAACWGPRRPAHAPPMPVRRQDFTATLPDVPVPPRRPVASCRLTAQGCAGAPRPLLPQVYAIAFNNPFGDKVVTGSFDKCAKVWDAHSGEELHCLRGHSAEIVCVAFSPAGSMVATGGSPRGGGGQMLRGQVAGQAELPAGRARGCWGDCRGHWRRGGGVAAALAFGGVRQGSKGLAAWSAFGGHRHSQPGGLVCLLRHRTASQPPRPPVPLAAGCRLYGQQRAAVGRVQRQGAALPGGPRRGGRQRGLQHRGCAAGAGGRAADWQRCSGRPRASGSRRGLRHIQDAGPQLAALATPAPHHPLLLPGAAGDLLVTGSFDHDARLWDVRSGKCVHVLSGHRGEISSAAFNYAGGSAGRRGGGGAAPKGGGVRTTLLDGRGAGACAGAAQSRPAPACTRPVRLHHRSTSADTTPRHCDTSPRATARAA